MKSELLNLPHLKMLSVQHFRFIIGADDAKHLIHRLNGKMKN